MARRKKVSDDVAKRLASAGLTEVDLEAKSHQLQDHPEEQTTVTVSQQDSKDSPNVATFKSIEPYGVTNVDTTEVESTIDNSLNQIGAIVTRLQMDLAGRAAGNAALVQTVQQKALSSLIYKTASGRQAVDDVKMKVDNAMQEKIGAATQPIVDVQEKLQGDENAQIQVEQGNEIAGNAGNDVVFAEQPPNDGNEWAKLPAQAGDDPSKSRYARSTPAGQVKQGLWPTEGGQCNAIPSYDDNGMVSGYACPNGATPFWANGPDGRIYYLCGDASACQFDIPSSPSPQTDIPVQPQPEKPPTPQSVPRLTTSAGYPSESKPSSDNGSSCIRLCDDSPKKSQECKEQTYKVYCTEGGTAYIIKSEDTPHSPTDKLIDSGTPSTSWIQSILQCAGKECQSPQDQPSSASLPGTMGGSNVGFACDLNNGLTYHTPSLADLLRSMGLDPDAAPATLWSYLSATMNPSNILGMIHAQLSLGAKAALEVSKQLFACQDAAYVLTGVKGIPLGILNTLARGAFDNEIRLNEYTRNQVCQTILPSGSDAIAAWLAGEFSLQDTECILKSNGQRVDWASRIAIANRTKFTPLEAVSLYRRGIINAEEYNKTIRSNGYIYPDEPQKIWELSKQIPVIQDIVRFMVRDTDDEKVVRHFGLDSQFTEKYGATLKKWGEEQGIDDKYARYMWRAHWSIPSPTQLYEMYRRLRWKDAETADNQVVEDIRTALVQQDILPFWIDRLLELATLPLTRTDAKRAFMINAIDESRLWLTFVHGGYSDKDATTLTDFVKKEKQLRFARHSATRRYAKGELSTAEFKDILSFEGATEEDIARATRYGKSLARATSRQACSKAIKRRFMLGEIDLADIVPKLQSLGIDPDIASMMSSEFDCERQARGKRVPLMTLSKWYKAGVIDKTQLAERMTALQFDWGEIESTIDFLDNEIDIRKKREDEIAAAKKAAKAKEQQLAQQRLAARQQQAAAKAQRELESAIKQSKSAAEATARQEEKKRRDTERALKAANVAQNRMEDYRLKIAEGLVKLLGGELGPSLRFVKNVSTNIGARTQASREDILRIGIATLADKSIRNGQDFADAWQAAVSEGNNLPGDDTPAG